MFSSRLPGRLEPNRLTRAIRRARIEKRPLVDLTTSNPTTVGLRYPGELLMALARPAATIYEPDPRGLESARAAVTGDYARRGIGVASSRVVLTASTSEAYSILFKLLCAAAGDAVLVPAPSYPLFDHLTRLDGVQPRPYRLEYHGRWTLDEASVDDAWTDSVRAVLAVSPNNPTGSVLSARELDRLSERCAERDAALIVDEVFADYEFLPAERGSRAERVQVRPSLTFRLGGLSKSAGLPQVKLGWIAVSGPEELVDRALERLDLICDTYLSVSTPVQVAAPELMARGADVREQILARVRGNYETLGAVAAADPAVEVLRADGGWSAVLRVPATRGEEDLALDLLERGGVVVHPGFFFDFPHEAFLVVSLLPEPQTFADGVRRIMERIHG
jgi:aspartate/methionine/tyrosine aminotransferase